MTTAVPSDQGVTVRYWAGARAAAGVDTEGRAAPLVYDRDTVADARAAHQLDRHLPLLRDLLRRVGGATVEDVVAAAVSLHPALRPVAAVATFLVDGSAANRDRPVPAGATVEVLPPFAGG